MTRQAFKETCKYAKEKGMLIIADIKRGDIGSTAQGYSNAYLGKTKIGDKEESIFDVDFVKNNVIIGSDAVADTLLLNVLPKYQGFDNFYITKKPLFYQFDRTADGSTTTSSAIREIDNDNNVSGLTRDKKA